MLDELTLADKGVKAPGLIDKTNIFRSSGNIDLLVYTAISSNES
jgi:hypothetical protein